MKLLGVALAVLTAIVIVDSDAKAQTTLSVTFPNCLLRITTNVEGLHLGPETGMAMVATSPSAWTPSDGCGEMFANALGIAQANPPALPNVPRAEPSPTMLDTANRNDLQPLADAVAEQVSLVNLIEKIEKQRTDRQSTEQATDAAPIDPMVVNLIVDRVSELRTTITSFATRVNDSGEKNAARIAELQAMSDGLVKRVTLAATKIKELQAKEAKMRKERDVLNNWLLAALFVAGLFLAITLLVSLWLAIKRRVVLSSGSIGTLNPDRQWVREAIEEKQWLARKTRFLPYAISALTILSAIGVLLNVLCSRETIIDPITGGALLATLLAVIGVAKTAGAWRDAVEGRIIDLLRIDVDLAKQGP